MIGIDDFTAVEMRVGEITNAAVNHKARLPAYVLTINFGSFGIRTSSAQLTQHYALDQLVGKRVIAVTNLPPRRVAGVKSEVLVLASIGDEGTLLVSPDPAAALGALIA